jgi:hypothetical protein
MRAICWIFLLLGSLSSVQVVNGQQVLIPRGPLGLVWEAQLAEGEHYHSEVAALVETYEDEVGVRLAPAERGQVGIKVNTRSGRGLSTPLRLLRAVIDMLELRGYDRESIMIIDYSGHQLRQAGIMPPLSSAASHFEGCRVLALDSELYYDANWFYDSPLPPSLNQEPQLFGHIRHARHTLQEGVKERQSFLARPLLFDVDFWVNLSVGVDDWVLGVDGALANATLWNVSNSQRFLGSEATASAAIAEIAAIPELSERMVLHFISLDRYQYIGGPRFKSRYSRSEPLLWMSSDPVAIDRLLYDRMNHHRLLNGFPEITPLPRQFSFAASLGLGVYERSRIRVQRVVFAGASEGSQNLPDSGGGMSPIKNSELE